MGALSSWQTAGWRSLNSATYECAGAGSTPETRRSFPEVTTSGQSQCSQYLTPDGRFSLGPFDQLVKFTIHREHREAIMQYLLLINDSERRWETYSPTEAQALIQEYGSL